MRSHVKLVPTSCLFNNFNLCALDCPENTKMIQIKCDTLVFYFSLFLLQNILVQQYPVRIVQFTSISVSQLVCAFIFELGKIIYLSKFSKKLIYENYVTYFTHNKHIFRVKICRKWYHFTQDSSKYSSFVA